MGSKLSVDDSVRVVIVGGGFGGIATASQLKSWGIPFVLVDMRDAFHHNVGALRASVQSGFAKKTFISYAVTFGESFRQAKVVGIDLLRQKVLLNDGEGDICIPSFPKHASCGSFLLIKVTGRRVELGSSAQQLCSKAGLNAAPQVQSSPQELFYSHLILATGSDGPFPGKFNQIIDMETAIQTYEDMVKEVQKSPRIVIVGGGAAGVEMAAEIKTEYPAKEVTLIHSKIALADVELLPCVRQVVKEILLKKEVRLLLSDRVSNLHMLTLNRFQENMAVKTEKGREVAADMVILCTGIKINSSAYSSAFGDKLASNGALKVNQYLQVEGYDNIYAIGDCTDVKEPKMAYHAGLHADIVVTNIINSLTQKPLKTYQPGSLTFLLSMGRNDGVGQINGCYVGRLLVTIVKSRDLFVCKSWKTMEQTMPC
ncbi:ferroptosis suppressor protein 1 isoform X1 [Mauremys reevesii]|uniref:ferroptosis suppressor protein 1 isoform X1 n=1 Tax=Mauremys reevesii TaxID=260615 RepID=UPI00193FF3F6|nr:ferroptosis suppressor protein 1 isoform X1 [Mauremys reevesii]XP_039402719.1 ferroptosis suppressor protein 1 isoform X1 [Mauremys reevesii]XP_039402721.1 ferroptosis suppressor protein 1 isoform X1 [Mauremys reevesii]XP_039402722.1 ferroptosis suppressor protein 1 isoform X1 [Mauremys reevesii]XP_039402723.1 ferroptosis suppressor protein 1 isoform X1 [Mauremys reevesii]XP_039402724.1 ferroptosis suppressor protein 1 isoform X1 [Mauremys reevesii]